MQDIVNDGLVVVLLAYAPLNKIDIKQNVCECVVYSASINLSFDFKRSCCLQLRFLYSHASRFQEADIIFTSILVCYDFRMEKLYLSK